MGKNERNPSGYGKFLTITVSFLLGVPQRVHLRRHSLCLQKFAHIAVGEVFKMGSPRVRLQKNV